MDNITLLSFLKETQTSSPQPHHLQQQPPTSNTTPPPQNPIGTVPPIYQPATTSSTLSTLEPVSSIPIYLYKYPQITLAVQTIHHLFQEWEPPQKGNSYELECRFGQWCGQYFQNGVSKAFFDKTIHTLSQYKQWHAQTHWSETHDFYLGYPPQQIRYTTFFDHEKKSIRTEVIRKIMKHKINLKFTNDSSGLSSSLSQSSLSLYSLPSSSSSFQPCFSSTSRLPTSTSASPLSGSTPLTQDNSSLPQHSLSFHSSPPSCFDLRVCLNEEESVRQEDLPESVNPVSVRIKSRMSFWYKSENFPFPEPTWKFDLTKSWLGSSKSEAEQKQKQDLDTQYEIELECLNPKILMSSSPSHDSFYVACSMLLKMKDLIGQSNFRWDPIQKIVSSSDMECF